MGTSSLKCPMQHCEKHKYNMEYFCLTCFQYNCKECLHDRKQHQYLEFHTRNQWEQHLIKIGNYVKEMSEMQTNDINHILTAYKSLLKRLPLGINNRVIEHLQR